MKHFMSGLDKFSFHVSPRPCVHVRETGDTHFDFHRLGIRCGDIPVQFFRDKKTTTEFRVKTPRITFRASPNKSSEVALDELAGTGILSLSLK
jgi:hypothetical protein